MNEAKTYTLEEAQQHFAKTLNGKVWDGVARSNALAGNRDEALKYIQRPR